MNPDSLHFASNNLEQDTAPLAPGEVQTGERQSGERRKWVHNSDFSSLLLSWVLASVKWI